MKKKKPQILVNVMHFVMVPLPSLKLLSSHDYVCDEQKNLMRSTLLVVVIWLITNNNGSVHHKKNKSKPSFIICLATPCNGNKLNSLVLHYEPGKKVTGMPSLKMHNGLRNEGRGIFHLQVLKMNSVTNLTASPHATTKTVWWNS